MAQAFKASVTFGDKTIVFEGPRDFVEEQVARYTGAELARNQGKGDMEQVGTPSSAPGIPERDLVLEKKPQNHPETVAVLAFCLTQQGTAEFTDEDIRRAYLRAGTRPPKVVAQAIRDAKNNFDFIEAGSQRGTHRLSHHGERSVRFDLPRQN
jgi:hypothetical protein